ALVVSAVDFRMARLEKHRAALGVEISDFHLVIAAVVAGRPLVVTKRRRENRLGVHAKKSIFQLVAALVETASPPVKTVPVQHRPPVGPENRGLDPLAPVVILS